MNLMLTAKARLRSLKLEPSHLFSTMLNLCVALWICVARAAIQEH